MFSDPRATEVGARCEIGLPRNDGNLLLSNNYNCLTLTKVIIC